MRDMKKSIFKEILKQKTKILFILLMSVVANIAGIFQARISGSFIDYISNSKEIVELSFYIKWFLVLGIFSLLTNQFVGFFKSIVEADIVFKLNLELVKIIKKFPLDFFIENDAVYIGQRVNADINTVVGFIINLIVTLPISIIYSIVFITLIYLKSKFLGLFVFIILPIYMIVYIVYDKKLRIVVYELKERQASLFSGITNLLSHIKIQKLEARYETGTQSTRLKYSNFRKFYIKNGILSALFNFTVGTVDVVFLALIFIIEGIRALKGSLLIGDIIVIQMYYTMLLSEIASITSIILSLPECKVSKLRIDELFCQKKEINGNLFIESIQEIKLDNVTADFLHSDPISHKFQIGKTYLIKGKNGAGKSTLLNMMLGVGLEHLIGNIIINGVNIIDVDVEKLKKNNIVICNQEAKILSSSIREELNLSIGAVSVLSEQFIKVGHLDDIIKTDKSINTLSTGERQKLLILRAINSNHEVLIFDEPTSALDENTVNAFISALNTLKKNKMIIIISHDKRLDQLDAQIITITGGQNNE